MARPTSWQPRRHPEVSWLKVDDDIVALDRAFRAHLISGTGALIWQLVDGEATVDQLADDVHDVFEVATEVARRDIVQFLDEVLSTGLLVSPFGVPVGATVGSLEPASSTDTRTSMGPDDAPGVNWVGFRFGTKTVAVESDDPDDLADIRRAFAEYATSTVSGDLTRFKFTSQSRAGLGPRALPSLVHENVPVLQSRMRSRLRRRLAHYLNSLIKSPNPQLAHFPSLAGLIGPSATLVPHVLTTSSSDVEELLIRNGLTLAEGRSMAIDLQTRRLVVTEEFGDTTSGLVDDLAPLAGEYEINQIFVDGRRNSATPRSQLVIRLLELSEVHPDTPAAYLLEAFDDLSKITQPIDDPADRLVALEFVENCAGCDN